jgi:ABC-2 type transport system ATP-binding protein
LIEAKGLTKRYGPVSAIEDVSFEVGHGEITGFLGPNGAGKSTTMRILTGYSPATSGSAVVAGYDIGTHPIEVKRNVGYLPESVPLYEEMVVTGFLSYVAEVKGVAKSARKAEVGRVMERCGLAHMAKRLIQNLSKGYRQRVGLAQALVGDPPVLILDEPTVGLDPKQIVDIRQMIKELAEDHTVLISTHILPEVVMICQQVVIINHGRIVSRESVTDLGATTLDLRLGEGAERAPGILNEMPYVKKVSPRGQGHFVIDTDGRASAYAELVKCLVENQVEVQRIEERSGSLEDRFMAAISREAGDGS